MSFGIKNFATALPQDSEVEIVLLFTASYFEIWTYFYFLPQIFWNLEVLLLLTTNFLTFWKYFYFVPGLWINKYFLIYDIDSSKSFIADFQINDFLNFPCDIDSDEEIDLKIDDFFPQDGPTNRWVSSVLLTKNEVQRPSTL
jgi:hypothetical protein